MSDFLALCQRTRQECGIAGAGPLAVTSQVGVHAKIVNWVARAWVDIQASRPFWKFLRATTTQVLVVGQQDYSVNDDWALTAVDKWDVEGSFIYETSVADQTPLAWKTYPWFRSAYRNGFTSERPTQITEVNGDSLRFNHVPDVAYTVTMDYWMTPELLASDTDVPGIPEQYHDAIVWKAVMMFAGSEGATELYNYAKSMYTPMYMQLVLDQCEMPHARAAYPLAKGYRDVSIRGFA